jgi:hypothetical protein
MSRQNKSIIGYILTDLAYKIPVYKHSGMCVVSKSGVTRLTSVFKFYGELPEQKDALKDAGLILHRDFFTMNKELYIQVTGSSQQCDDTIMITIRGLRKLLASPNMRMSGRERTKSAIKQLEVLEQKLFPKKMPESKVIIASDSVNSKPTPGGTIVLQPKKISILSIIVKHAEAMFDEIADVIAQKVLDKTLSTKTKKAA